MSVKGGMKLVVIVASEFQTAMMIWKNLTDITLSKTARYKNVHCVIPFYRRYSQARLSYAIRNHDSETPLAGVVSRRAHRRGTLGPQYGLFLVLGVGYLGVLSW